MNDPTHADDLPVVGHIDDQQKDQSDPPENMQMIEASGAGLNQSGGATLQMIDTKDLVKRQKAIVSAMHEAMTLGIHYGVPYKGSKKNVLLKPGAEVLGVLFQLAPTYKINTTNLGKGHREHTIICKLHYIPTGSYIGQGVGSCSTLEKKYRYRNLDEFTGVPAPYEANEKRKSGFGNYQKYLKNQLNAAGVDYPNDATLGHGKNDDSGQWEISIKAKGENPDIADEYNTVLKIAKKRAQIDAILTATGASELFTQDVDDFPDYSPEPETDQNSQNGPNSGNLTSGDRNRGSNSPSKGRSGPGRGANTNPPPRNSERGPGPRQAANYPDRYPPALEGNRRALEVWEMAEELPTARTRSIQRKILPGVDDQTLENLSGLINYYLDIEGLVDRVRRWDVDEGKAWAEALSAAESIGEIKTIGQGLQQFVLRKGI